MMVLGAYGDPINQQQFVSLCERADELHAKLGYAYVIKRKTGWLSDSAMSYVGKMEQELDLTLNQIFDLVKESLDMWVDFHTFEGSLEHILGGVASGLDAEYWYNQFTEWVGSQPALDRLIYSATKHTESHATWAYESFDHAFNKDKNTFIKIWKRVYPYFMKSYPSLNKALVNTQNVLSEMQSPPADLMDKAALYQKFMNLVHSTGPMLEHILEDDSMARKVMDDLAHNRYINDTEWKKEVENKLGSKVATRYLVLAINVLGET
ncbi:MAG: hypothetical protein WC444_04645 [Candidatus Paceibacterota bacterium]